MQPLVDGFLKGRAVLKKKIIGSYFDSYNKPKKCCHLGAVIFGIYGKAEIPDNLNKDFPEIWKMVPIPCEHQYDEEHRDDPRGQIGAILIHLNDKHTAHSWPDKKVADWLESALSV